MKNKKGKGKVGFYIVGFIILAFLLGWFNPASFGSGQVERDSLSISEGSTYYTYTLNVDYSQPEINDNVCGLEYTMPVNVGYSERFSPPPTLPTDIKTNTYFPAQFVDWQLSASPNDVTLKGGLGSIAVIEKENNVECQVTNSGTLNCKGDVLYGFSPTACSMQRNDLTIRVKIDKIQDEVETETQTDTTTETPTDTAGNPLPPTTTTELSTMDKINLWIQSIVDWFKGIFK